MNSHQEPTMGHKVTQMWPCPHRALVLVRTMECGKVGETQGCSRRPPTPEVIRGGFLDVEDQEEDKTGTGEVTQAGE